MKVCACVISWNSADQLAGALDSLAAQTHPDLDVLVIDNASVDASRDVAGRYPGVRLLANAGNRGFAGAANQAVAEAAEAGADALLLANPDVVCEPDYLARAVAALAADPARAAVQGRLWRSSPASPGRPPAMGPPASPGRPPATGAAHDQPAGRILDTTGHQAFDTRLFRNRGEGEADDGRYDQPGEVFGVSGALALYRLAALDDVAAGGDVFDADLFAFWEDVDLDWRLRLRGWSVWYAPDAQAWHERGGAGPRRSALVERLNFANRFLVVAKNDDAAALARALPGVTATTVLKAGELALTVPSAFVRALPRAALLPRMLDKRRTNHARARVDPADVVARWFGPFDYTAWVRTWWRRVRGQG